MLRDAKKTFPTAPCFNKEMAKKKIIKPSRKRLIFNKIQDRFISFEDDLELQALELEKQNAAKSKALTDIPEMILAQDDDEPSQD